MTDALFTLDDLAVYLAIPKSRIHDQWRAWGLPALRVGRSLRFRRSEVDEWLERRRET